MLAAHLPVQHLKSPMLLPITPFLLLSLVSFKNSLVLLGKLRWSSTLVCWDGWMFVYKSSREEILATHPLHYENNSPGRRLQFSSSLISPLPVTKVCVASNRILLSLFGWQLRTISWSILFQLSLQDYKLTSSSQGSITHLVLGFLFNKL